MKNKTQEFSAAIPTVYNGVQLKSRFEAQSALLFDALGWEWKYEPESVMLPSGINFMPDFWLPVQRAIVEVRGYDSDKGNAQIKGFRDLLNTGGFSSPTFGTLPIFVTIGPDDCTFTNPSISDEVRPLGLAWCSSHDMWVFSSEGLGCPDHRCISGYIETFIDVSKGKIAIAGSESEEWHKLFFADKDICRKFALDEAMRKSFRVAREVMILAGLLSK